MRNGYVLLWSAAGPGVKVRLQAAHRQSCTTSSFFLRVPRRVRLRPPQCGQDSGCLLVSGTRAMRGMAGGILLIVCAHGSMRGCVMQLMAIEREVHADWSARSSRISAMLRELRRVVARCCAPLSLAAG